MLTFEVSWPTKTLVLLSETAWFAIGAGSFIAGVSLYMQAAPDSASRESACWNIAAGLGMLALTALTLADDWRFRRLRTRYRANARTLAILRPGRRTVFIKRDACMAMTRGGTAFQMADGTECSLDFPLALFPHRRHDFLAKLFDLWWPSTPYMQARRFFEEETPRFNLTWNANFALCFALLLAGVALTWGSDLWATTIGLIPAVLVTVVALAVPLQRHVRRARAFAYRLPEATSREGQGHADH